MTDAALDDVDELSEDELAALQTEFGDDPCFADLTVGDDARTPAVLADPIAGTTAASTAAKVGGPALFGSFSWHGTQPACLSRAGLDVRLVLWSAPIHIET